MQAREDGEQSVDVSTFELSRNEGFAAVASADQEDLGWWALRLVFIKAGGEESHSFREHAITHGLNMPKRLRV